MALGLGLLASFTVFSSHRIVFSASARVDETVIDLAGILGSMLALSAAVQVWPLRERIWIRFYIALSVVISLALAFEFLLGFLWFAFDKFVPFGQRH